MPHPNILGGLVLLTLLGPASLFLLNRKPHYPALILFGLGIILLILTFSRSAWLGFIIFAVMLIAKSKDLDQKKLILFISATVIVLISSLLPLRELILPRVRTQGVAVEQISTVGRFWLDRQAIDMFRGSPVLGVGIGSFILELSNTAVAGAPIEPVHNVLLLVMAELGLIGLILFLGICSLMVFKVLRSRSPATILAGAMVAGLGVISLFDHYLWTLAPGRIMLGLAIGLWAGQVSNNA